MSFSNGSSTGIGKRIGCVAIAVLLIALNLFVLMAISTPADCPAEFSECANAWLWRLLIFPGIPLLSILIAVFAAGWMSRSKD